MVLIEPPPGWTAPQDSEPESSSAEAEAVPPGEPSREPGPPDSASPATRPSAPVPPQPPEVHSHPADMVLAAETTAVAEPPVTQPPAPPLDGDALASEPVSPTEDWTAQAARQRQQWLLLGGAAIGGVVLALGLAGWLASRAIQQADATGAAPAAVTEVPAAAPAPTPPEPSPGLAPPATAPAPSPSPAATGPAPAAKTAAAPEPVPAANPPADAVAPSPPVMPTAATPPPAATPAEEPPSQAASPAPEPAAMPKTPDTNLDPGALSETLNAFAPFIDPNMDAGPPQPMDTTEPEVTQLDPQTLTSQQPSVPRPEPRAVDVAARLQDKIAEVEFADVPLKNFVRFIMNFSTIPVSLDPDALALVRATPRSTINVRQADATVAQLLAAGLAPLQLAPLTADQQLIVTRPPLADGALRTYPLGVSDLVGNDPQALRQLADLIVEVVEPASWEAAGGAGLIREEPPALVIQQQETILFRAIVFCDRLRAARGLPPQSKFDPALFSLEPRLQQAAPRLAKPVTLNFPQPASFTRILDRLSDEGGVETLIDWPALVQLGWTPDTETTLTVNQRPVGDVLTELLQPMELTYRVLDASTVQVTSPAAAQARWDIEFYPLAAAASADQVNALLTQIRSDMTGGQPEAFKGVLHVDAPSRRLIAALPQASHLKLAELLHVGAQTPPH